MAYDYLAGQTEASLVVALGKAQAQLKEAKPSISVGSGDVTAAFQVRRDLEVLIERIYDKLSILNPTAYPPQKRASRIKMVAHNSKS